MQKTWAAGVTTVPSRETLLHQTLVSLAAAGFLDVRLFTDHEQCNAFANWWTGMISLYTRNPGATFYAMFQDDLLASKNLRQYLEHCHYPPRGYWNLYTFLSNEEVINRQPEGWMEAGLLHSSEPGSTQQTGRSALGLVFSREALVTLLSSRHFVGHPQKVGGKAKIDSAIVHAMNGAGWREYIHNPSLLQHTGQASMLGKGPKSPYVRTALSFRGENWDCLSLVKGGAQ